MSRIQDLISNLDKLQITKGRIITTAKELDEFEAEVIRASRTDEARRQKEDILKSPESVPLPMQPHFDTSGLKIKPDVQVSQPEESQSQLTPSLHITPFTHYHQGHLLASFGIGLFVGMLIGWALSSRNNNN